MNFCPQCKSALFPEKRNGTIALVCIRCGVTSEASRLETKIFDKPEPSIFIVEKRQASQPDQEEGQS